MQRSCLFSTAYFGPVEYFVRMISCDSLLLEALESYPKQTYRNRCRILGPNGTQDLVIPVLHEGKPPRVIRDIRIEQQERWQIRHWRTLLAAYSNSPYFLFYHDDLKREFFQKDKFLLDYNHRLLTLAMRWLHLSPEIRYTVEFQGLSTAPGDWRYRFSPKQAPGISFGPYHQVFSDRMDFVPGLSILDLVFNTGPGAKEYLISHASR